MKMRCPECGWEGDNPRTKYRGLPFRADGKFDVEVELVDLCPECGAEVEYLEYEEAIK